MARKTREGICYEIILAFDVMKNRIVLFEKETPTEDSLGCALGC